MIDLGKVYFIQEYEDHKLTQEFRGDCSLDEIIANFEMFLKGAGYHFEGHLDIVYDEEDSSGYEYACPECGMEAGHKMSCTFGYNEREKASFDKAFSVHEERMDVAGGSSTVDSIDFGPTVTFSVDDSHNGGTGKYPAEDSGIDDYTVTVSPYSKDKLK